jgi:serine/threonine-protein kinase
VSDLESAKSARRSVTGDLCRMEKAMQTLPFAPAAHGRVSLREVSIPIPLLRRFRAGDLLAEKYRLERRIGEGAMGEVWLAENVVLEMPIAVKLLRRSAFEQDGDTNGSLGAFPEELAGRLMHEARATAKLIHPGIVRTLDFGRHRGYPFLVLERLEGEDLRARLDREGTFTQTEAVRLVLPVIDALQFAHARGVVHRDLKPENVFLATDETGRSVPKVLDFGVAVLHASTPVFVAGTPAYMAPEQREGRDDADHRVDVYAVAVMLLEMITGHRPLEARDASEASREAAFFASETKDAVAVLWEADPHLVSPPLADILMRGLAPNPHHRWATMRAFGEALAEWAVERGLEDDASGMSLRSHWLGEHGVDEIANDIPVDLLEPAPEPARPIFFADDPVVLPKKRSWAALGALGTIVGAAALSLAMAFNVTSFDALRARLAPRATPVSQDPGPPSVAERAADPRDEAAAEGVEDPAARAAADIDASDDDSDALDADVTGEPVTDEVAGAETDVSVAAPAAPAPAEAAVSTPPKRVVAPATRVRAPVRAQPRRAFVRRAKHAAPVETATTSQPVEALTAPAEVDPAEVYPEGTSAPLPSAAPKTPAPYEPDSL